MARTASERKPPITKSALSRVITRSMALVASGTDWISLVSPRMSSICLRLPATLMPPALLISSRAISAPAQWFSPWTNAIGPRIAILIVCACAPELTTPASASAANPTVNERSMALLLCTTLYLNLIWWEDFKVGDQAELGRHTFTEQEIVAFGRQFDPQPFHVDVEKSRDSIFGGL